MVHARRLVMKELSPLKPQELRAIDELITEIENDSADESMERLLAHLYYHAKSLVFTIREQSRLIDRLQKELKDAKK